MVGQIGSSLRRLMSPLSWLRVQGPGMRRYQFGLPLILAILLSCAIILPSPRISVLGPVGLVATVNGLLQALIGFYIAALAAVSTFSLPGLEQAIIGSPIVLNRRQLTRRQLLSLIFGFLSLVALCLHLAGSAALLGQTAIRSALDPRWLLLCRGGFTFLYVLGLSQLFVTTLLGLDYLAIRLQLEPEVLVRPRDPHDTDPKNR